MGEIKIYCGRGKTMQGPYGQFYKLNMCLEDIPTQHMTTGKNGKHYFNLAVNELKNADDRGNDLTVTVDTWKPNPQYSQPTRPSPQRESYTAQQRPPATNNPEDFESDQIPF